MGEIIHKNGKRYYNNLVNTYNVSKNIIVDKNCSAYQFTNIGDTTAMVNGMLIYPGVPGVSLGDSRSISLEQMDIYRGNMELSFQVPVGVNPRVEIVQLVYMQDEQ